MPKVFKYTPPQIDSAGVYYFTTDAGIDYEVRFGRKKTDILAVNIVFGVLNEEYDGEEYIMTNAGEFYSIMMTITDIVQDFHAKNPNVHCFEFAGEPRQENQPRPTKPTKRTRVFLKWAHRIFSKDAWMINLIGNKVFIERLRN